MERYNRIDQFDGLRAWIEKRLGYHLDSATTGLTTVLPNPPETPEPLVAFRLGNRGIMRVQPSWVEALQPIVNNLTLDELFSTFGAYEMARITLADGISVWGPSWYYCGDEEYFSPSPTDNVVQFSSTEVEELVDEEIFWHCNWQDAASCFGIAYGGKLVALATVNDRGASVYEIDVDVAPESGHGGLGRAVVSAAGLWILQQGGLILATTAPWNIPSARLLRSVGLQYILCDMVGKRGPFRVPPQPLGKPHPDTLLFNHYPSWGMNQQIQPQPK